MPRNPLLVLALALVAACSDVIVPTNNGGDPPNDPPKDAPKDSPKDSPSDSLSAGLVVSGLVPAIFPGAFNPAVAALDSEGDAVVYVSMLPGTVAEGTSVVITNNRTNASVTESVADGGFDPAAIAANVGDTLSVTVTRTGAPPLSAVVVVSNDADLRIVRTRPPQGQTDVPVNTNITIVFSEPVAPSSLTDGAVTLFAGTLPVAGTTTVQPGVSYAVQFTPSSALAPVTEHRVVVQPTVTNLGGTVLQASLTTSFTTEAADAPTPMATIRVAVTTSGVELDPDGFSVQVQWGWFVVSTPVALNATVDIPVPARDGYIVQLTGFSPNCAVDWVPWFGALRQVDAPGGTVSVSLPVTCEAAPVARLGPGMQLAFVRDGRIYRVDSDGTNLTQLTAGPRDASPAWSPDGQRIAFARTTDRAGTEYVDQDIYIMNADGTNVVRRTNGGYNGAPTWSPDGTRIAFESFSAGSIDLFTMAANDDGAGATALIQYLGWDSRPKWSPDGAAIAFVSDEVFYDASFHVYVATPNGSGVTRLTEERFGETRRLYFDPTWSPDGSRLAMSECHDGYYYCDKSALAVMNRDGSGKTLLVSGRHIWGAAWSPDGQAIAYSSAFGIQWVAADGSTKGVIEYGHSPAWRPTPLASMRR